MGGAARQFFGWAGVRKFHDGGARVIYGAAFMDVGCPKCQTEYELDDARVTEDGVTVKCTSCGHVFRVKKKQLVVTLPARGDEPISLGSSGTELPPAPPAREWKLRQPSGNIYPCRELTTLQKWIIEGKVSRDDEISLSGETWKRLGNIPELASFFQIVDDALKVRALEAMKRVAPPAPLGPAEDKKKITDTWREGQFSVTPAPSPVARTTTPQIEPGNDSGPSVMQTLQGGRFSTGALPAVPVPLAQPPAQTAKRKVPEPTDEELRRALGKGGGSGKWAFLIFAGLAVGGAVGYYFGVYEPQQRQLLEQRASEQARLEEEARVKALAPQLPGLVLVASVEEEREADAGLSDAGTAEASAPDAGPPDAGAPTAPSVPLVVDAGPGAAAPVVVKQERSFDWYVAQGDRLRERDKPEQALDFYDKALNLKPDRVEPLTGRGLALLDMANPSAAATTFQSALQLNSRYGPAIMGLAEAYRIEGKNEKAVEFYQRYLDVLPNGAEASVARNSIERLKK